MNHYSENLFAAIDTIVAERLNKLNFDRTGIYTIVSQDEKDKTKYWVTDGSIRFLATASEGVFYSQNQLVYVMIPLNNYDGDKVILGAYTSTDTTKNVQTYVDPYSRFVKSTPINIPKESNIVTQIQGTSDKTSTIISKTIPFTTHHPNQPYEYIGVTMAFDVDIKGYDGNYALIFEFLDSNNKTLHGTPTPDDLTDLDGNILVISSKLMHGNPFNLIPNLIYNFVLPYPQEMKPEDIDHVNIILALDGLFANVGNIILTDLELAFGYNKDNLKANTSVLGIGADETLKYADYDKVKIRTLNLDWIYQDAKTKEFFIFNLYNLPTNIFEEYIIYWLHYVDGAGENKDLSNNYNWVTLAANTDFSYQITLDTALKTDLYKALIKYKLKSVDEEKDDTTSQDTTVKEEYLFTEAEGLIFESTLLRAEPGAANASGDTIRFSFLDNCNGIFNYYGLDDRISETSRGSGPYTIVANFLDSTKWDLGDSNSRIEKVEWITPTVNTMINTDKDIVISDNKKELSFYIKTIYLHEATNNRIECVVTFKNGEIRRGSINLLFGQNQTNGTTYAFNIDFVGSQNCLYLAGDAEFPSEILVLASLTKSNGDPVTTPPITWSWVHLNDDGENDSHITITSVTNNIVTLSYNQTDFPKLFTLNDDEKKYANFSILQATIENYNAENGVSVDLKAYLPIPLAQKDYTDISGATRIVYDTLGNSVSFSRNPYTLYKGNTEETNTVYWKCIAGPGATEGVPEIRTINVEEKLLHTLKPISYCPPEIPMACIAAYLLTGVTEEENEEGEIIETPETELVWLQPLLIVLNSWNSDMVNDWDGSVEIDTEKGSIKSPMFMAGKKIDNNLFTGLLLGDVLRASVGDAVGLYGFLDSLLRYRLDENGAFYVGSGNNNFISFNERIDGRSGANELVIKALNFILETKYLTINSKELRIAIYSDEDNSQARVILGKIIKNNEDTVYGLDIYEGAFRIYGKPYSTELKDIDASLYFHTEVDGTVNMYINGLITRTHTFEETYKYNQKSYTYSTTMNNRIGEIETAEINIDANANTDTTESLFNGYYISCNYNNKSENLLLDENILNYKWTSQGETVFGYPYGRSISYYYDGLKQTVPFVLLCRGTDNPVAYIIVGDKSNLNSTNSTKLADLILAASVQKVPKLWKNLKEWNSLHTGIRIRQDAVYDPNGSFYLGGIGFKGAYFDLIESGDSLVRLLVSSSTLHVGSGTAFNGNVVPELNEKYRLGSSSYKWTDIYATNNTIQTSDRNLKTNISVLPSKYKQLFTELIPVSFTFIDNTSNRTHIGFISLDVELAMHKCGISDLEFAGFCKDIKTKVITNKLNEKVEVEDLDENGNRQYIYSLRYTEFIAIITAVLQDTINLIADIEVRLSKLEKA